MNAKAVIAPFAEPFGDGSLHAPFGNDLQAGKALTRPKVFGPERIVEDPRVKAVHQRLLWEIYVVALFGSLVSVKLVLRVRIRPIGMLTVVLPEVIWSHHLFGP
jgi:hypothetical protein